MSCAVCGGSGRHGRHYCTNCLKGTTLNCRANHRGSWAVVQYHCNFGAFNGYHETPSDYSGVQCGDCGRYWRTKAAYVERLTCTTFAWPAGAS